MGQKEAKIISQTGIYAILLWPSGSRSFLHKYLITVNRMAAAGGQGDLFLFPMA